MFAQSISKSNQQFCKEHKVNIMRVPLISSTIMSITYADVLPHVLFSIKTLENKRCKIQSNCDETFLQRFHFAYMIRLRIRLRVGYYTSQVISHLESQLPFVGIRLKLNDMFYL